MVLLVLLLSARKRLDYKSPFPESEMEEVKFRVNQRSKMHKAISEFIVTVFLLILLCSIGYTNRDPHGFLLRTNLQNQLFRPLRPVYKPGAPLAPTDNVHSVREYYVWLNYTVMDAMFPQENYNDDLLGATDRLLMSDLSNLRVGAPRLRLLRERKTSCSLPYLGNVNCIPPYSVANEDTRDYCEGWNSTKPCNEDEGLRLTSAAWTFIPAWKIWGIPIAGTFKVYGGGGYIAELDISRPVAKKSIAELIETMWIDRRTRAVFLEFTVYSTNLNMFAYISLLSEFPETGAVFHYTNIFTFRSLQLTGTLGSFVLICEILFMITTVVWVVVMGVRLLKERWTFFTVFWNIVELATVGLSFAAVVLYLIRLMYTNEAIAKFKENSRIFINFYHISVWDGFFIYVVAILIALVTMRLIKVLGLTKFTRTVFTVLKQSSKTLPGFFFYIFLILLAFAACGTLFFGPFAKEYKDIITCLESLFSGVLGHAGFTKMNIPAESNWFGLIYFITFIIVVTFTLANIFMTILLDTMDMLAQDRSNDRDLELTTYLWHSAKEIITGKKTDGFLKAKSDTDGESITRITTFRQLLMTDVKNRENAQL
ncbi:polycystin-2-like [Gigantopelta aegis]|uniref:polycystin-2-like n=1 Tax=Gigantopelta aegis TaxID=1735272 RepID=UPI001B88C22D|nr:polycystin-2-like [Gigantopelta aegis]